jgi:catechol 2,3-dioxygenase-like lactoylglutathione lyase family enzyme
MDVPVTRTPLTSVAPFFIVSDVRRSIAFYADSLGFEVRFRSPEDGPFFAILQRDGVRIVVKAIAPDVLPVPNHTRHAWARWDAFVHTPQPDALAAEFTSNGLTLHQALADTEDQLRGFEVKDVDGYVLFFGRPI